MAGLTLAIGGLAAAGGAAFTEVAMAAHSRAPGSAQALDVLPFPGTSDAAPGTNIDLPAVSPAQVEASPLWGRAAGCTRAI